MDVGDQLLGKYLGVVADNRDPSGIGRITVRVTSLGDHTTTWAAPCFPVAGDQVGILAVPPVGSPVYVEFIERNIDLPVWVGCPIGDPDRLSTRGSDIADGPMRILLESGGVGISIEGDSRAGGKIVLFCGDGPTVTISASGIDLDGGGKPITITGSSVDLNDGGLTVR